MQLFLPLPDLFLQHFFLLVQQQGNDTAGVLFGKELADGIDGKAQVIIAK